MRRVWSAVAASWALLAIVAALAWSHPPTQSSPTRATVLVVKGKKGKAVLLPSGVATHTTTQSSPPAGRG